MKWRVGFVDVGLQRLFVQLMKPPAPDDVVHAAVQAELVALRLHGLQLGDKVEADRPGERGFQNESRPAGFLDEVYRIAVGQLGAASA